MSSVTTFFVDELARLVKASEVDAHVGAVQTPCSIRACTLTPY